MLQLSIRTTRRSEMVNITAQVGEAIRQQGFRSGICYLFVPHTTAAVTVNEGADPAVSRDIMVGLDSLVPRSGDYVHQEGNSAAHIKASLVGLDVAVPVEGGQLQLGTWQAIFFCEFDGPRERRIWVKLIGG